MQAFLGNVQNMVELRKNANFCEIRSAVFEFFRADTQTDVHGEDETCFFYSCYFECAKKGK